MSAAALSLLGSLPWSMILTLLTSGIAITFAWFHGRDSGIASEQAKSASVVIKNETDRAKTDDDVTKLSDAAVRDELSQWTQHNAKGK